MISNWLDWDWIEVNMWLFILGCFVGSFMTIMILALCNVAGEADRHIDRMALEKYEREKAEAKF